MKWVDNIRAAWRNSGHSNATLPNLLGAPIEGLPQWHAKHMPLLLHMPCNIGWGQASNHWALRICDWHPAWRRLWDRLDAPWPNCQGCYWILLVLSTNESHLGGRVVVILLALNPIGPIKNHSSAKLEQPCHQHLVVLVWYRHPPWRRQVEVDSISPNPSKSREQFPWVITVKQSLYHDGCRPYWNCKWRVRRCRFSLWLSNDMADQWRKRTLLWRAQGRSSLSTGVLVKTSSSSKELQSYLSWSTSYIHDCCCLATNSSLFLIFNRDVVSFQGLQQGISNLSLLSLPEEKDMVVAVVVVFLPCSGSRIHPGANIMFWSKCGASERNGSFAFFWVVEIQCCRFR